MIYEWLAQSDLTSSMLGPPFFPDAPIPTWDEFCEDYAVHFFDGTKPGSGRSFIILASDEAIGHVSYDGMDVSDSCVELDIWLRAAAVCGLGYGSDALLTLVRHLHEAFGVTEFILRPSRRNTRAIRAYSKAGFVVLPVSVEQQTHDYGPCDYPDAVVMRKTSSEPHRTP